MSDSTLSTPVMFFLGPGGVGKSTISALKSIEEAYKNKKVLVATFDPSPRLKDILVKDQGYGDPTLEKNLKVVVLDSKAIFESLLEKVDLEIAKNIKNNKLFMHLLERIQGVQEFSSLYFLNEQVKTNNFDIIIIDTPPLQNSVDFFSAPQKLKDLFESTIVKLFIGDFNKNWFERVFKKTRDIAFATLKKLTGHEFFDQLISLMKALEALQPIILSTLNESQIILNAQSTKYSFVTSYEEQNLAFADLQMNLLKTKNICFQSLFINKYHKYNSEELIDIELWAKKNKMTKLEKLIDYKQTVFQEREHLLKSVAKNSKFSIYTIGQFHNNQMKIEDLVFQAGQFNELKN